MGGGGSGRHARRCNPWRGLTSGGRLSSLTLERIAGPSSEAADLTSVTERDRTRPQTPQALKSVSTGDLRNSLRHEQKPLPGASRRDPFRPSIVAGAVALAGVAPATKLWLSDGYWGHPVSDVYGYLLENWTVIAVGVAVVLIAFFIGRWWVLLLVLAVPLAFPFYGEDADGAPRWFYPTLFLGPPLLLALAVGVVARKLYRHQRRRATAPRSARS